jgi:hypothetical protein
MFVSYKQVADQGIQGENGVKEKGMMIPFICSSNVYLQNHRFYSIS